MRVIPSCTIQVRFELVGERFSGGDRALLNRGDTIEPRSRSLKNSAIGLSNLDPIKISGIIKYPCLHFLLAIDCKHDYLCIDLPMQ